MIFLDEFRRQQRVIETVKARKVSRTGQDPHKRRNKHLKNQTKCNETVLFY